MLYREMFDEVHAPQGLKEEVLNMTRQDTARVARKVSTTFVIAAVLAVVLAGTALAAVAGVPQTLQEWFGKQWTESGGGEMPQEQSAVIDSLVQPVGVSVKNNGVTVTLDSVTPGEGGLWLMLKIQSSKTSGRLSIMEYDLSGGPMEKELDNGSVVVHGGTLQDVGFTEDGAQIVLMLYHAPWNVNFLEGGAMELMMKDLMLRGEPAEEGGPWPEPVMLEGEWVLPFTLAPAKLEALTIESAVVPVRYSGGMDKEDSCAYTEIHDLKITPTGYHFSITPHEEGISSKFKVVLQLKNGMEINGTSSIMIGNNTMSKGIWDFPVNISEVDSVRFCLDDVRLYFDQDNGYSQQS